MKPFDRDNIVGSVRERAESDSEFRERLLDNPSAVMSEMLGVQVPDAVRITVHEESPTDIHLVISAVGSLSDTDLDLVVGGDWTYAGCASSSCLD